MIFFFSPETFSETVKSDAAIENAVLEGVITDFKGHPTAGGEVFAYTGPDVKRPGDFISKTTTEDGRYQLILPPGNYWTVARQRPGGARYGPLLPEDRHSGEPRKIEVAAGDVVQVDFSIANIMETARLHRKKREDLVKVEGCVLGAKDVPTNMAYAMASTHRKPADVPEYLSNWTNEDGKFILYLPVGTFFLGATKEFPPTGEIVLGKEIHVKDEMGDITIILSK